MKFISGKSPDVIAVRTWLTRVLSAGTIDTVNISGLNQFASEMEARRKTTRLPLMHLERLAMYVASTLHQTTILVKNMILSLLQKLDR